MICPCGSVLISIFRRWTVVLALGVLVSASSALGVSSISSVTSPSDESQISRLAAADSESISSMKGPNSFLSYYVRFCQKFWEDFTDWPRDNVIVAGVAAIAPPLALYLRDPHKDIDWGLIKTTLWIYLGFFGVYIIIRAFRVPWKLDRERADTASRITVENNELIQKNKEIESKLHALQASANVAPVHNIYFPAPPVPLKPEPLKHNVQCAGVDAGEMAARIGFINIETPNQEVGNFHRARLKVRYSLAHSGEEVALVFPARWIGSDEDEISIEFVPRYAVLAVYIGNQWHGVETIEVFTPQSECESYYRRELKPLPTAQLRIEAILFGEKNLSLLPFTGILTLEEDGAASWTPAE